MGNPLFLPGVGPLRPDDTSAIGEVGADVTVEEACGHAGLTGLILLAAMREAAGNLGWVVRVGKVFGMVNAPPGFNEHPRVINGCSDLAVEALGDRGRHTRSAVAVASLPFNITSEIEAVIDVA